MKCWSSIQKLTEVAVSTKTRDLERQDKLAETQFKVDLGSLLIENSKEIHVADVYLKTGIIEIDGQALVLPVTKQ